MTSHEISVNIPQTLDPVYSNMIQIAYKEDEFTFVFLHQIPGVNQARAKAIVSITPVHAKNLLAVLSKTMSDYESKFGKIETSQDKQQGGGNVTIMRGYS
jgi:iron-sulfur cluster repair protein YtfE (RIC family)